MDAMQTNRDYTKLMLVGVVGVTCAMTFVMGSE